MPEISVISFAARHCAIGLKTGMPPPTLASNKKLTLLFLAIFKSSAPFAATSSLFEVTTLLPLSRHCFTKSYAGLIPPITSATIFTESSFKISLKSLVNLSEYERPVNSRKSRIYLTFISPCAARAILSLWYIRISATPDPTTP